MQNPPYTDLTQQRLATGSSKRRLFKRYRNTNDKRAKINWPKQEKEQKQKKRAIFYIMHTKYCSLKAGNVLKNAVCRVNVGAIYSKTTSSKNKIVSNTLSLRFQSVYEKAKYSECITA